MSKAKTVTLKAPRVVPAGTITKATGTKPATQPAASPMASMAAIVTAAPVAPVAPAPVAVALRGGLAVAAVALGTKPYNSKAPHNVDWWATINKQLANGKPAAVAEIVAAKVPTHFVGYCVRKGYLKAV